MTTGTPAPRQGPGSSVGLIDRIRDRDAFIRLRRDGVRVRMGPLWCSYLHDPNMTSTQVAFSIGRNVGNAVDRNRLRRRSRDVLSRHDIPTGLLMIGARPGAGELTFAQLHDTLASLVARTVERAAAT